MSDRSGALDGKRLFYQVWEGSEPRAEVVVAHGYAEHSGRYAHVAKDLVEAGLRVWAIDHRGHGESQGERGDIGSWDDAVADLDRLVDEVVAESSGGPVFLLGHSMGGAIAVAYALAHQHRLSGLVLSASAVVIPAEMLALADLDEIPALPLADAVSTDPAVVQAYKDDPLVHHGPPPRNLLQVFATTGELLDRLGEVTLPVLVMHGSGDLLIPAASLKALVNGLGSEDLTARLWPGLFHEILNEPTGGAVLLEILSWINARLS